MNDVVDFFVLIMKLFIGDLVYGQRNKLVPRSLKAGNDGKLLVGADYFHRGQNRSQKVGLVISNDRSEMTKYRSLALSLINRQISKLKFCPGPLLV